MKRAIIGLVMLMCAAVVHGSEWSSDREVYCSNRFGGGDTVDTGRDLAWWQAEWERTGDETPGDRMDHAASLLAYMAGPNRTSFFPIGFSEMNVAELGVSNFADRWEAVDVARFHVGRYSHNNFQVREFNGVPVYEYGEDGRDRFHDTLIFTTGSTSGVAKSVADLDVSVLVRPNRIRVKSSGNDGHNTRLYVFDSWTGLMHSWYVRDFAGPLHSRNVISAGGHHDARLAEMHDCGGA